jgi:hypothetical protein
MLRGDIITAGTALMLQLSYKVHTSLENFGRYEDIDVYPLYATENVEKNKSNFYIFGG